MNTHTNNKSRTRGGHRLFSTLEVFLLAGLLALSTGAISGVYYPSSTVNDIDTTILSYDTSQGGDGTYWEWRYQHLYNNKVLACPASSKTNCRLVFDFTNTPKVELITQFVFNVKPHEYYFVVSTPQDELRYKYNIRDESKYTRNRRIQDFSPTGIHYVTVKPGQYAFASLIALDKYVQFGRMMGGRFPTQKVGLQDYNVWSVGKWDGHVFKRFQLNFCVNSTGSTPNVASLVKCNKPADIPNGVSP